MERTTSACPQGRAARAQSPMLWLGTKQKISLSKDALLSERTLQIAAGLHLFAIAAAVLGPSHPPLPILLTVTGLLLVLLSLTRSEPRAPASAAEPVPELTATDVRNLQLERQSQRLVEIADAASRARREAEMRGHLWAELTARMSHELRTPLNAVIGFSDLMNAELFGPLGDDRYRDYSRHIRECGRDLLKCAEDTLALTSTLANGRDSSAAKPLDLDEIVAEAWSFFAAESTTRGIRLEASLPAAIEIVGEPRPTRQILINLFAEALARAPDGGDITIAAEDDGETVALSLKVDAAVCRPDVGQAPLAVCIARVLLEQSGSGLLDHVDERGAWRAQTFLDRAAQQDFFAPARL